MIVSCTKNAMHASTFSNTQKLREFQKLNRAITICQKNKIKVNNENGAHMHRLVFFFFTISLFLYLLTLTFTTLFHLWILVYTIRFIFSHLICFYLLIVFSFVKKRGKHTSSSFHLFLQAFHLKYYSLLLFLLHI